jgi:uncharacterized membrane protein YkoI
VFSQARRISLGARALRRKYPRPFGLETDAGRIDRMRSAAVYTVSSFLRRSDYGVAFMLKTTSMAAAAALALALGTPAAFAQSSSGMTLPQLERGMHNETPTPDQIQMVQNAKTSLSDAINTAQSNTNGQNSNAEAFAASFADVNGAPLYRVDVASNGSIYKMQIDANTGKPIGEAKIIPQSQLSRADGTLLATLPNAKTTLADAVGNATGKLNGKAFSAALTDMNGQPAYDVTVVDNGQVKQASVDQVNGNVAALPAGTEGYGSSNQK